MYCDCFTAGLLMSVVFQNASINNNPAIPQFDGWLFINSTADNYT